jgi:uncharacterized protein YbjT (DUF2867 family)
MRIVVVGGNELIGSRLVTELGGHGHETVAASPDTGVDTLTGEGLAAALAGASVVVDVSNPPSSDAAAALEALDTSTRNLLAAEAAAGVRHHVALSVDAKLAHEELIATSSIPYSIVRAPPSVATAAAAVAGALARIAVASPVNGIVEIAGPDRFPRNGRPHS